MMLDVRSIIIVGVVSFFIGVMGAWWLTASYKDNKYTAEIQTHNAQEAQAVATAHENVNKIDAEREATATELEVKFAKQQKELDRINADNRRLVGMLSDKTNGSGNSMPENTSTKPSATTATRGKLPTTIAEELVELTRDADTAAAYATSCYEWVKTLK